MTWRFSQVFIEFFQKGENRFLSIQILTIICRMISILSFIRLRSGMMEELGFNGKRTKKEEGGSDSKLNRESSNASRNSSSSKFLKRKPDGKKLFLGNGAKKRRETSATEYFDRDLLSDQPADSESLSEFHTQSDKNMGEKHLPKGSLKIISDKTNKMLESAKSQSNLFLRRKQLDIALAGGGNLPAAQNGNNPQPSTSQNNSQPDQVEQYDDYAQFAIHSRVTNKKSRTEFFTYSNFQSEVKAESVRIDDGYELSSTRQPGELSKEYRRVRAECESYVKKNKMLQQEMELYMEREYLLQTEKKHMGEIIKEKDKIIDRLQREKAILGIRNRTEIEKEILKSREQVESLKRMLAKEEERMNNLKQENEYITNELVSKSEELKHVYDKYDDLEKMYHEDQALMLTKFEKMKQDIERPRDSFKEDQNEFTNIGQLQKWKEKIVRLQQQVKYLKIQNQCLLISKDQLRKCELENRKLKDERDYFKRKVLESVKRTKRNTKDVSSDNSSSVLLELSQVSIEK